MSSCQQPGEERASHEKQLLRHRFLVGIVAKPRPIARQVQGVGVLIPAEQVEIRSEVSGRIRSLLFQEGQRVAQGTLLVKLEDAELLAEKAKAQSQIALLEITQARRKQQLDLQAISQQDYDQGAADLASAQANLALVEAALAKTEIRAPFAGLVGLRQVSPGAVVSVGQALVSLVQSTPLKLEFSVSGEAAPFLRDETPLSFDAGTGKFYEARVYALAGILDSLNQRMLARAIVQGDEDELIPGTSVTYQLKLPTDTGYVFPPEVISGNAQGTVVYVDHGGKAIAVPVLLGRRLADQVEIRSGLNLGDTVLLVGASQLQTGQVVTLKELLP